MATTISLLVIGTAMTTFKDAVAMTARPAYMADTSLNMRAGINLFIRDLDGDRTADSDRRHSDSERRERSDHQPAEPAGYWPIPSTPPVAHVDPR